MLALIAGRGALPREISAKLTQTYQPFILCSLEPDLDAEFQVTIGGLGLLLENLVARGVDRLVMAGGLDRGTLKIGEVAAQTLPFLDRLSNAMEAGDNGALEIVIEIIQEHGIKVVGAHEILPELLPPTGVLGSFSPYKDAETDAKQGAAAVEAMGEIDLGQSCVIRAGRVLAVEAQPGTEHMLTTLPDHSKGQITPSGILYKAPKPGQDRRADLPTIGPQTIKQVANAGLGGLVIEANGVMVLAREETIAAADKAGLFIWVREATG